MISFCIKDNHLDIQDFLMSEITNSQFPDIYYSKHKFKIYKNVIVHYVGKDIDSFFDFLSHTIENTIVKFYEPKIIKNLLSKDYFYFGKSEKNAIFDEYYSLLKSCKDRKITEKIEEYIRENNSLILDGFVRFRLKDYISFLSELLESAVSKFVLDKEYFEFVSLLRAYVDSKIPSPIKINLIYVNQESLLVDTNGNIIEYEDFDSEYLSDITFSENDYALNTLIGKLPQEISVHLISPKDEFINTLELIFGKKLKICTGCEICSAYKLLNL